jgi:hypothetical protein
MSNDFIWKIFLTECRDLKNIQYLHNFALKHKKKTYMYILNDDICLSFCFVPKLFLRVIELTTYLKSVKVTCRDVTNCLIFSKTMVNIIKIWNYRF